MPAFDSDGHECMRQGDDVSLSYQKCAVAHGRFGACNERTEIQIRVMVPKSVGDEATLAFDR